MPRSVRVPAGVRHEETVVSRGRGGGGYKKFHFNKNIFQQDSTKLYIISTSYTKKNLFFDKLQIKNNKLFQIAIIQTVRHQNCIILIL